MGMYPEFGSGSVYERALSYSPVARAFILEPKESGMFLKTFNARGEDIQKRCPGFELREIKLLITVGQSLGVLLSPDEEDDKAEWEGFMTKTLYDIEALFFMGYELEKEEHIDELFGFIFTKACEFGYIDIEEENKSNAEAFVDIILKAGAQFRDLDNCGLLIPSPEPPAPAVEPPPKVPDDYSIARNLLDY